MLAVQEWQVGLTYEMPFPSSSKSSRYASKARQVSPASPATAQFLFESYGNCRFKYPSRSVMGR